MFTGKKTFLVKNVEWGIAIHNLIISGQWAISEKFQTGGWVEDTVFWNPPRIFRFLDVQHFLEIPKWKTKQEPWWKFHISFSLTPLEFPLLFWFSWCVEFPHASSSIDNFRVSDAILLGGANSGQTSIKCCDVEPRPLNIVGILSWYWYLNIFSKLSIFMSCLKVWE